MGIRSTLRFLFRPRYRSEVYTRWRYRHELIQVSTASQQDRYPKLLESLARQLGDTPMPQILSFGCSDGAELRDLSALLSRARFTGVDINHRAIRRARRLSLEAGCSACSFYHSRSWEWQRKEHYDAILALAVLQKTENREADRTTAVASFSFADFESRLEMLHQLLKPGGLLVLDHCDYAFEDTRLYSNYHPAADRPVIRDRPLYDRDMNRIPDPGPRQRVFIRS